MRHLSWAVAGVYDAPFTEGWGDPVPAYPTYRVLSPRGGTCLLERPCEGPCVLVVRLFLHLPRPPSPALCLQADEHRSSWRLSPGWNILREHIPEGPTPSRLVLTPQAEPHAEYQVRVVEVRLLDPRDPRADS